MSGPSDHQVRQGLRANEQRLDPSGDYCVILLGLIGHHFNSQTHAKLSKVIGITIQNQTKQQKQPKHEKHQINSHQKIRFNQIFNNSNRKYNLSNPFTL